MLRPINTLTLLASMFLLVGCATQPQVGESDQSGFLADYSVLQPLGGASSTEVLRWVNPNTDPSRYYAVLVDPVAMHPEPLADSAGDNANVAVVLAALDAAIDDALAQSRLPMSETSGEGVLHLRSALTTVRAIDKPFSANELIPIRLVFSGLELAADGRDQEVTVVIEYELSDSQSGEVVAMGIRKGQTEDLASRDELLSEAHLMPLLEQWGTDFRSGLSVLTALLEGE
ncbi:MAG: DUF3313 domain-containing protein [Pseudomonadota bacterium]